MNCQDAREVYSRGETGLTEWALVHAHVMQCVECQKARESLPQRVASSRAARLPRLRPLLSTSSTLAGHVAVRMFDGARTGVTRAVDLLTRVRGLVSVFVKMSERAAANAIGATRFAMAAAVGLLIRLGALLSISLTMFGRVGARGLEGARVGATRVVELLTGVRGLVSAFVKVSERAAASAIGATRFAMANSVELLTRLRVLLSMSWRAVLKGLEGARVGAMRVRGLLPVFMKRSERVAVDSVGAARSGIRTGDLLTRLRAPLAISLTVAGQAAVRTVEVARAAAPVIERARFAVVRVAHRAFQRAAQAAIEVGRAGGTRGLDSLTRLRARLSISLAESGRAAGRLIAATRAGAVQLRDLLIRVRALSSLLLARSERAAVKALAATWAVGRVAVTPASRVRPILKVCTAIGGLAVLIAVMLTSWPRPWWPDGLTAQRDVRRPVERTPVEPATVPSLVQTAAPKPVSAPERAPVVVSPPDAARMSMRPRPFEAQSGIPAPSRGSDPALARSRASASAPISSTEGVQSADAADSTAAIDWLLKGGSGRRRVEGP